MRDKGTRYEPILQSARIDCRLSFAHLRRQDDLIFDADVVVSVVFAVVLMFSLTSRVGEASIRFPASCFETFPKNCFVKLLNGASTTRYRM